MKNQVGKKGRSYCILMNTVFVSLIFLVYNIPSSIVETSQTITHFHVYCNVGFLCVSVCVCLGVETDCDVFILLVSRLANTEQVGKYLICVGYFNLGADPNRNANLLLYEKP